MSSNYLTADNGVSSGVTGITQSAGSDGTLQIRTTTSGGTATTALTINNSQQTVFANTINVPNTFGFKNRIINGAMVIDQRNAGASVTNINGAAYTVDRWAIWGNVASKFTAQQNAGGVTPPSGYTNYLGITSSSAYSVSSSDYFMVAQQIEGFNTADLNWGTVNAKTVTLSFWVYSSLTGTFGGCLENSGTTRSYPFTYSIPTANTWTQISVTVAGDTTGTWVGATNGIGIRVWLGLGVGSTFSGTAGSWASADYRSATGGVSVVGTNGATFYITGVQLEVGTQATSFDFRSIGTELALCQRYFEQSYDYGTIAGAASGTGSSMSGGPLGGATTGYIEGPGYFKVTKRATPTMLCWDSSGNANKCARILSGSSATVNSAAVLGTIGTNIFSMNSSGTANANIMQIQWTASSEL
jgi:hypothetical protein